MFNKRLMVWVKTKEVSIEKLEKGGGGGGWCENIMFEIEQSEGTIMEEGNLNFQCADSYLHVN